MIRRPTSGNTSTGALSAPGAQRELDNEATLRERATWMFIAMSLGGVVSGLLLLIGAFRFTGLLG